MGTTSGAQQTSDKTQRRELLTPCAQISLAFTTRLRHLQRFLVLPRTPVSGPPLVLVRKLGVGSTFWGGGHYLDILAPRSFARNRRMRRTGALMG